MVQLTTDRRSQCRARLAAAQLAARDLRTAAFVRYTPLVCGHRLTRLTLPTYTTLLAWKNAFVCGGPIAFKDLAQFVWLHHPAFDQFAEARRRAVFLAIDRALTPAHPILGPLARFATPQLARRGWFVRQCARFTRRWLCPTAAELRADAIAEIRRLVHEATHDFPPGDDDGDPTPYALQAQLVSFLLRGYDLDFHTAAELVATLPLAELNQYVREIVHRLSKGKASLLTPAEAAVWRDYLADDPPDSPPTANRPEQASPASASNGPSS